MTPIFCYVYARLKYGAGKEGTFFKYMLSHSNPALPILYTPHEEREKIRLKLYTEKKGGEKDKVSSSPASGSKV